MDDELKTALETILSEIRNLGEKMDTKFNEIDIRLTQMMEDIASIKRDVKHLKKEAIRLRAMDDAIFDEVERVHDALEES